MNDPMPKMADFTDTAEYNSAYRNWRKRETYRENREKVIASVQAYRDERTKREPGWRGSDGLKELRERHRVQATRPNPGVCEICGSDGSGGGPTSTLHRDHCHTTMEFRGWLCGKCNKALGLVNDDVEVLRKMIKYLGGK